MPRPRARWLLVLAAAAALVVGPTVLDARPAEPSTVPAVELADRARASAAVAWSGDVATTATLQLPESESFAGLGQLLGEDNQLRVWWRDPEHWRVDRIRGTGETDLFRMGQVSVRWVFESETATVSPVSRVRLPDASDLLPPTLARTVLQGARSDELTSLPARRVAGVDAAGLRLTPADPAATLGHVDLWLDARSGLPLRVELFAIGERRPALVTTVQDLDLAVPPPGTTEFDPPASVQVNQDESVDAAAAANAFARLDLPPSLGELSTRDGTDPGAVGVYGRGPTSMIVLPLRGRVAVPLRERLDAGAASRQVDTGVLAPIGPVNLLLTSDWDGSGVLLAGTVSAAAMQRAAAELAESG